MEINAISRKLKEFLMSSLQEKSVINVIVFLDIILYTDILLLKSDYHKLFHLPIQLR